ncbi:methyltransferase [Phyllobacterium phragmitis]|uniref:Methyltransferase n=2 Tax=Phyllobacterium phragmitis TaxID=2670329 RepID=A0A2S9IJC5_9HYPH|nr:methyltransferase [Phyllobacterium phragmitis]
MGYTYVAALRAATELGVADHLADGPREIGELAQATKTDKLKLYRILRLLATRGVFREEEGERFALTLPADFLRTDRPQSQRSAVLMLTDETFWRPIGELAKSVRGEFIFKHIFGMSFFEYWAQEGVPAEDFHRGMSAMSEVENQFLVRSYDFPKDATVVDVAGGLGGLLLRVLRENPTLHGILFDRQHVLDRNRLGELGDDKRWKLVAGDFFKSCPKGDIYLLKYIMHDWSDENDIRILRNIREAMAPGARVLIMDPVLPEGNTPHPGKEMDLLTMGIYEGGRERTEKEFHRLLAGADLRLNRIIDTGSYVSIVEAVAA